MKVKKVRNTFFEPPLDPPIDYKWEQIYDTAESMTEEQIREDLMDWGVIEHIEDITEEPIERLWVQYVYDN